MQMRRSIISVCTKIMLLTYGLSAFAQPKQWVDDLLLVESLTHHGIFFIDENNAIKRKISFASELPDFKAYSRNSFKASGWRNDGLYAAVRGVFEENADGFRFVNYAFTKWQDGEWDVLGFFKLMDDPGNQSLSANSLKIIPCDNDRFIVISNFSDLSGNTGPKATPFTRVKLNPATKEIKIEASIDHGVDELVEHMSNVDDLGKHMANMKFFMCVSFCNIFITGNHATLIDNTGLYWVFSLEKATLVKSGNIFKSMTLDKNIKAFSGGVRMVLASNPQNDGSILISTREEAVIDVEIDFYNEFDNTKFLKSLSDIDDYVELSGKFYDSMDKARKKINARHPWIEWHRFYPESGKTEKFLPAGAAIELEDRKNESWRPMPDGSVKMGSFELFEQEKPKPAQDKEKTAAAVAKLNYTLFIRSSDSAGCTPSIGATRCRSAALGCQEHQIRRCCCF
jgi:hypothetical protein